MEPSHRLASGLIVAIEYDNGGFPMEIWDVEGLCAGALYSDKSLLGRTAN